MLPHPPPAAAGRRPSLDGVARVHRAPRGSWRPARWRAWALLLGSLVLQVVLVAVLQDGVSIISVVVIALVVAAFGVRVLAERRSWTELGDDGVRVSGGLFRPRHFRWEQASTVLVEGPYQRVSALRLRSWVEVELPHLPADVAQHLHDQLEASSRRPPPRRVSADPPSSAGPRPDDDLDLEGPFRRGPRRR